MMKQVEELTKRLVDDFGYNEVEARKIAYEQVYGD